MDPYKTIDTAPKTGVGIMVWVADGDMQPHWFAPVSICEDGSWWDDSTGDQIEPVKGATHWCHLPAPPAAAKEE